MLHTPGVSPGAVCVHLPEAPHPSGSGVLLVGPTLAPGVNGPCDGWDGAQEAMFATLQTVLAALPDDVAVLPGAFDPTA